MSVQWQVHDMDLHPRRGPWLSMVVSSWGCPCVHPGAPILFHRFTLSLTQAWYQPPEGGGRGRPLFGAHLTPMTPLLPHLHPRDGSCCRCNPPLQRKKPKPRTPHGAASGSRRGPVGPANPRERLPEQQPMACHLPEKGRSPRKTARCRKVSVMNVVARDGEAGEPGLVHIHDQRVQRGPPPSVSASKKAVEW